MGEREPGRAAVRPTWTQVACDLCPACAGHGEREPFRTWLQSLGSSGRAGEAKLKGRRGPQMPSPLTPFQLVLRNPRSLQERPLALPRSCQTAEQAPSPQFNHYSSTYIFYAFYLLGFCVKSPLSKRLPSFKKKSLKSTDSVQSSHFTSRETETQSSEGTPRQSRRAPQRR